MLQKILAAKVILLRADRQLRRIYYVFSGTTNIAVGENGGAVTVGPQQHLTFASKEKCMEGYQILKRI